jgi:uncharacterized protein (TIGR00369 family)
MGFREHVGLQVQPGDEGQGSVLLDARDEHLNAHGTVHGGVLATMLDVAMGTAVATAGGESPVTVSLTVTYLEPARPGPLRAVARVRKRGRRLIVVEGQVEQDGDDGTELVADALATFSVKG